MRVGWGFDVHALEAGGPLKIGGVEIPFEKGLIGHSDGDVLLHATADALLGAAGLGDLGDHFPSHRADLKGVSSLWLLQEVAAKVVQAGYRIQNIDCLVIAEQPRMSPHTEEMRRVMAKNMGLELRQINVKSKSTDGLGMIGRGEGIAAQCIVLLEPLEPRL